MKLNANGRAENEIEVGSLPKLSELDQSKDDEYVAEIRVALAKAENSGASSLRGVSCILPRTTCEYERSKSISKIKGIRGISPQRDIPVKFPEGSEMLLVSKVYFDSRFQAVAQAQFRVNDVDFNFMRISGSDIRRCSNQDFKQILIIPCHDSETTMVVLVPHSEGSLSIKNMHSKIMETVKNIDDAHVESV